MAKILRKGQRGAARAYVTRSAAIKKLQISLADFRRLCILKGIFPREPRHRKRANKGNSVSTSFYYAKDIAYLAHEPVLQKLREHKAFAKKLSRALGRGEWSSAKSLDDNKPTYRLDHIVKERYPTFVDALRDIDDALCLVALFASLPSNPRLPPSLIESCSRLWAEWQLYVMHTRSLRKVFLSIKGVYFQAEVSGQTVTWLVPYMFTQTVPTDVDIRVMLTFLELYQTLLGFVFFKLYTDAELVYPPPLNTSKDEDGSGVNAYSLQVSSAAEPDAVKKQTVDADGNAVKGRDVRRTIKEIGTAALPLQEPSPAEMSQDQSSGARILEPPTSSTLQSGSALFSPYTFYLAPGSSRPLLEFVLRSFGGRVGWPASMGSGSPLQEDDESITHVIIDRPASTMTSSLQRNNRKLIQPQWIIDSINAQKALPEGPYGQSAILPPHLSPFGEEYTFIEHSEPIEVDSDISEGEEEAHKNLPSIAAAAVETGDDAALRAVELEAERAGISTEEFDARLDRAARQTKTSNIVNTETAARDLEMNKMLMSNKQRKLYERVRHSERKKTAERESLETKRTAIQKGKAKTLRRAIRASVVVS